MIDPSAGPGGSLGPEARALLDAARGGLGPDAAAVRRMRARIDVAAGGAVGTAIGVKLALLAAVVVGVGVGAGVIATRHAAVAVAPRVELASPPEGAVRVAVREPAVQPPSDEELIVIEPMAPPPRRARAAIEVPRAPRAEHNADTRNVARDAGNAASVPAASLSREVELLDLAMIALRRRDPGAAIRAVQQHATETVGRGQLAEDAAAIEIEALCHLHDPTASTKLAAFDARYPRSAQRSRLSATCP